MKVRKLSLIVVLVLLSTILLVAPVQAGRTPFTFRGVSDGTMRFLVRQSGPVWHVTWILADYPVEGSDPSALYPLVPA